MARDATAPRLFRGPYARASWSVCALVSLYAFEEMGVAAALPNAVADVDGLNRFGWVFTGFLASSVVGMATSAHLCRGRGPRTPIVAFVALFASGLLIAGTATTMPALVLGRAVQGFAGGGMLTALYVIAGTYIPITVRPKLFAAIASCWVVPGIVGPTASGAIAEHLSWRLMFLGIAPIALGVAIALAPALGHAVTGGPSADPTPSERSAARIGFAVLAAVAIGAVQVGAEGRAALSPLVVTAGAAGLVVALRRLLPPGTGRLRSAVGVPIALRGILAGSLFGVEAVIPLMLATQHDLGPLRASIPLACAGLPCAIASWWMGRDGATSLDRRVTMARRGFVLLALADASFIWLSRPESPSWPLSPLWVVAGFGIGLVVPSMNVLALERTTDADRSVNASSLQIADTTMACLTTGFAGVLIAYATRGSIAFTTAFGVIGLAMTVLALAGAVASGRLRHPV